LAYHLHIFRGSNWWEGASNPITAEELLSVAGVAQADSISTTSPQTGIVLSMPNCNMFTYKEAFLMLKDGMIIAAARNEDTVETIHPLADTLGAVIQGDEGEFY